MLGPKPIAAAVKNVGLRVDNPFLHQLLKALVGEWGYRLTDEAADDPLLIISEGLACPADIRHILTLSASHYQDRHRLALPLSVENLYLALENHFHRTPRNHIRISLEWPIQVKVRDQQFDTHTVTVADRGLRFVSPLELAREEEMEIHIERDDEIYDLHAKVVYSLVGREIGRGNLIEVGAVCVPQSKEVRESIRSRIVGSYLKRVRPLLDEELFREALKQLNLTQMSKALATAG